MPNKIYGVHKNYKTLILNLFEALTTYLCATALNLRTTGLNSDEKHINAREIIKKLFKYSNTHT